MKENQIGQCLTQLV